MFLGCYLPLCPRLQGLQCLLYRLFGSILIIVDMYLSRFHFVINKQSIIPVVTAVLFIIHRFTDAVMLL